uniref:NADH dehydrogenase subunit 6 n=1 Tax=Knipowitschia caucasica TaxID=637954 RepID=A0AAV2KQU4_KNICA
MGWCGGGGVEGDLVGMFVYVYVGGVGVEVVGLGGWLGSFMFLCMWVGGGFLGGDGLLVVVLREGWCFVVWGVGLWVLVWVWGCFLG